MFIETIDWNLGAADNSFYEAAGRLAERRRLVGEGEELVEGGEGECSGKVEVLWGMERRLVR